MRERGLLCDMTNVVLLTNITAALVTDIESIGKHQHNCSNILWYKTFVREMPFLFYIKFILRFTMLVLVQIPIAYCIAWSNLMPEY